MKFSNRFVSATKEYNTFDKHVPNPQFRKSFFLKKIPNLAEITICGLGYYELYLNGQNITKGYMAPYRSNPDHYLYYDHYNITEYLTEGENVFGILLGNGFLNSDQQTWRFYQFPFRSSPKVALCVEIDNEILFEADAFKWTNSPITFEEFHAGEYYDARLELNGWLEKDFDDSNWNNVLPALTPLGEPRIPDCDPIGIVDIHRPVRILKSKNGYIYDFVVNAAGLCELNIKGSEGQEVTLRYGEMLRENELDMANISYNEYTQCDRYTLKGNCQEKFMPHFTYHGFRFVEVIGITEKQATLDLLTFYEMSSSLEQIADFKCDNADINAIFDCTIKSDRANFMYFPTDCPQREKNGWTGDAALSAEQLLIYFNCARSLKEWLRNVFKAQNSEGAIPGIVPTNDWGFAWGNGPAWDNVMFELPYRIYQYTGDSDFIREAAPYLLKYLRYMETKRDENGLFHYGLGDWCHSHVTQKALESHLPYTDTITCKDICDKAAFMFNVIGDTEASNYAKSLSEEIKKSFRLKCINKTSAKIETQTAQAMAIYYDMFEASEAEAAENKLEALIHMFNDHLSVGVLGNRVIFRTLAEYGSVELALKMILNPTFPSFKFWLDMGCTSLPEDFRYSENRLDTFSEQDPKMNSFNHHFWGDVSAFFMRHLAGIQIENTNKVCIAPCFTDMLNNVSAYSTVPQGRISVEYKKRDIMVEMTVTVPNGIEATLKVPENYQLSYGKTKCKSGENHFLFCKK